MGDARVAAAMYAREYHKALAKIKELKAVVKSVKDFHEGNGMYDFSVLNTNDRGNESFGAWQNIYSNIKSVLAKE